LEFLGYPILIDAREAGGAGVTIQPIWWGMPFASTSVEFANLLPASRFDVKVISKKITSARFSLGVNGVFNFENALSSFLQLQKFHGLTLLKVLGPLSAQG